MTGAMAVAHHEALGRELRSIVDLTRRLVAIESPSDDVDGVAAVVRALAVAAEAAGCDVDVRPLAGCGPLLDARLALDGAGPTVLVLGHADTVWPVGTAASWPTAAADGWLTGPGVGDMKAPLATAVAVLDLLRQSPPPGLGAVRLLVVPDEERGSTASRSAIEMAAREAAACVVLEAARPGGGVVVARGAVGAMRLVASGVARHVTDPGDRVSALRALAALVEPIEALGGAGSQASAGVLVAGTARQVVPGLGELLVDLRATTTAAAEALAIAVRALAAGPQAGGATVAVEGGVTRPAYAAGPGGARLAQVAAAAAAALGVPFHEVVERGGSDASFPGALGVPTLDGLGPVCHGSCSPAERVAVADLPVWGAILAAVIGAAGAVGDG